MKKPVSFAKTIPPRPSKVILRKRLFRLIESGRKRPVIWVSSPAGSGKTTLVSSYLESSKVHNLWYLLDEDDGDAATFFYYMGLAGKKAAPRKRKPLPLLTPEYSLPTFTRNFFQDLFSRVRTPFCIVLDNYQDVPKESPFHELIREGLSVVPEGINVIIISRKAPPLEFARMKANRLMEVIGWGELRLTTREAGDVVRLKVGKKLPAETLRHLNEKIDGWMAGLMLMLEEADKEAIEHQSLLTPETLKNFTPAEVFNYFAGEIFERTDIKTRDFLLKTSFLSNINTKMAEKLTGLGRAGHILSDLNRDNYFTEKRFSPNPVYQYHPLFREFLLSRARGTFSPRSISRLQREAAMLLFEDGQVEHAADLFIEAHDWEGLAGLINKNAGGLLSQGRNRTLEEWLMAFPEEITGDNPWLLYWLGACRMPFNPPLSRGSFERAFKLFKRRKDAAGVFLAWSGVVNSIFYEFEDFTQLDRWIILFDDLVKEYPTFPSREIEIRVIFSMFQSLQFRRPYNYDIGPFAERLLTLLQQGIPDVNLRVNIGFNLAFYYNHCLCDPSRAEIIINEVKGSARALKGSPLAMIFVKLFEAIHSWSTADPATALKAVSEGLKVARTTGVHLLDCQLLGHGAAAALCAGDLAATRGFLDDMALYLDKASRMDKSFYYFLSAWHALIRRDLPSAYEHSKTALELNIELGGQVQDTLGNIEMALILFEQGDYKRAWVHLTRARRTSKKVPGLYSMHEHMLFMAEAQFALDRGDERAGLNSLRKAFAFVRERGIKCFLLLRHNVMARLCAKALEEGIEVEYVQDLIRRLNLIPDTPPVDIENWPWPIKIYTLGRFSLLKDGKQAHFPRKAQKKPLKMLKALISLGGRDVGEERLSDVLWPEADGDKAHWVFGITLRRLRKLLGNEKAIGLREGRLTLDPRYCWVDIWAFERILGQSDRALKNGGKKRGIGLIEKAIGMYQGHFLAGDSGVSWTISMRERLRSKFIRYITELGRLCEESGELKKSLECFKRGLEVDNLVEDFYQRLMLCHLRLGHRAEALSVYDSLKKILSVTLGVEPSPKTQAIYKTVAQGTPTFKEFS
jgi:ATP/maltotriose-dependent transcriptional regulator MalT/DNA-binding SARP family transcriptional activator